MEDEDEASTTDVRSKAQISPRLTPCVNPPNSGNKVHGDAVHAGGGCIQREPEASALPHKIDVQRDLNTVVSDNARQYVVHFQHATDVTFGDHIQLQQKDQDSEDSIAVDQGYRTIPMGDIALLKEVTGFRSPAPRVSAYTGPRFYAARVRGCQTTVAVHHGGEEAKDCWRREVMDSARGLGHPNLVQIFAKSSFNCRYVVVYHGDLIPVHKLAHSKSGSSLVEFWLSWTQCVEILAVQDEIDKILNVEHGAATVIPFFDPDSQRFCIEPCERVGYRTVNNTLRTSRSVAMNIASSKQTARDLVQHLNFGDMYLLLLRGLLVHGADRGWREWDKDRWGMLATHTVVVYWTDPPGAVLPLATIPLDRSQPSVTYETMVCGNWTPVARGQRHQSFHVPKSSRPLWLCYKKTIDSTVLWACQAEYHLRRLSSRGRLRGKHGPVESLVIEIQLEPIHNQCDAFLIIPPVEGLFLPSPVIRDLPYWSLSADSTGRLDHKAASNLGLPPIQLQTWIWGPVCPELSYDVIRVIHDARCFNPYGPDVANILGYPLFDLFSPPGFDVPPNCFLDEDWEKADESLPKLFSELAVSQQKYCHPNDTVDQEISYMTAIHIGLIVAGFLVLAGGF